MAHRRVLVNVGISLDMEEGETTTEAIIRLGETLSMCLSDQPGNIMIDDIKAAKCIKEKTKDNVIDLSKNNIWLERMML